MSFFNSCRIVLSEIKSVYLLTYLLLTDTIFFLFSMRLSFCKYFSVMQLFGLLFSWFGVSLLFLYIFILFTTFSMFVSVLIFSASSVFIVKWICCCSKHLNWLFKVSREWIAYRMRHICVIMTLAGGRDGGGGVIANYALKMSKVIEFHLCRWSISRNNNRQVII